MVTLLPGTSYAVRRSVAPNSAASLGIVRRDPTVVKSYQQLAVQSLSIRVRETRQNLIDDSSYSWIVLDVLNAPKPGDTQISHQKLEVFDQTKARGRSADVAVSLHRFKTARFGGA